MSQELPQLPAFLTQPLSCPPNRCNYPGRPLPPISTELALLLPKWFIGRLVNWLDNAAHFVRASKAELRETAALLDDLKSLPPKFVLENASALYTSTSLDGLDAELVGTLFPRVIQDQLPSLAREIFAAFGTDNGFSCVHDLLDPSQIGTWRRLCESPDTRQLPSLEEKDWGPLVETISGAISLGEVDATEWGTRLQWERDVTMIFQKHLQLRSENMGRKSRGMFESLGYRAALERPGA